uniref:Succinate:cytochrome c oxidoreductase subunit 4 n=1 Tax=Caulacanthus okamurae TaxID=152008 RepID=A0A6H1U7F8_9FLOR|nr:succinate:cytochrome c oxidoreductase subunit 4 [Caulacanthus okamurae]QIZ74784.1 succinate:cytochrome c oxidoreductase subunit 4 [Caulacanthus okamurae]
MILLKWIIIRLIVLFMFLGLLIDNEIVITTLGFMFYHISFGLHTILEDYIHLSKIKLVLTFSARILFIELFKLILELVL